MKKIIIAALIGLMIVKPQPIKANEIIVHKCQATGYSLTGIAADGSVITKESNNVAASKREWIGSTMIVYLDDGDGIIKAENYIATYEIRDTGGEKIRNGTVVDLHFSGYETAKKFGRKDVIVQIIRSEG